MVLAKKKNSGHLHVRRVEFFLSVGHQQSSISVGRDLDLGPVRKFDLFGAVDENLLDGSVGERNLNGAVRKTDLLLPAGDE